MLKKLSLKGMKKAWKWGLSGLVLVILSVYFFDTHRSRAENDDDVAGTALVTTKTVELSDFSPSLIAYGSITTSLNGTLAMTTEGAGIIKAIEVQPYQHVSKGEALIQFAATSEMQANIDDAKKTLTQARKNLAQTQKMRADYLATNSDVQAAELNLSQATANFKSLQYQYGSGLKSIKAPFSGIIGAIPVSVGQLVGPGANLLNLFNQNALTVSLGITPDASTRVKVGQNVNLTTIDDNPVLLQGKVVQVAAAPDSDTGLIDVTVRLSPLETQVPLVNTSVSARIALSSPKPCILAPRSAVLYQDNQAYVFIEQNHKAIYRNVSLLGSNDNNIAITSGINAGDLLIISGNYELQDGDAVRTEDKQ